MFILPNTRCAIVEENSYKNKNNKESKPQAKTKRTIEIRQNTNTKRALSHRLL